MMVTTHVILGVLLSVPLIVIFPKLSAPIFVFAVLESVFPDLDALIGTHRKSLHFPIYYGVLSTLVLVLFLVVRSTPFLLTTVFAVNAFQHSLTDIYGGGLERRPWEQTSTKAVYVHVTGKWKPPKHVIPYEGSREDLALTLVGSAVIVLLYPLSGVISTTVLATTIIAISYSSVRKFLPRLEKYLLENYPVLYPFLSGLHDDTH